MLRWFEFKCFNHSFLGITNSEESKREERFSVFHLSCVNLEDEQILCNLFLQHICNTVCTMQVLIISGCLNQTYFIPPHCDYVFCPRLQEVLTSHPLISPPPALSLSLQHFLYCFRFSSILGCVVGFLCCVSSLTKTNPMVHESICVF